MNLWIAAADNNVGKVKEFLASGLTANSKDENGYTPIHAAAEYGHLDLLRFLVVDQKGDVNDKDNDGDTPLHACEQAETAKLLVSLGARLDATNSEGQTPLQKAEEEADFPELIAFLRKESGVASVRDDELPDNVTLSVQPPDRALEDATPQVTEEQRAQLTNIIENGTDADFEQYLKGVLGGDAPEEPAKKPKTE